LRKFFEEAFGEVESAQVILNRDTKKSRGFGFVVFSHPRSVDLVLARQYVVYM
jgi:RNA recognition motif-containing protein